MRWQVASFYGTAFIQITFIQSLKTKLKSLYTNLYEHNSFATSPTLNTVPRTEQGLDSNHILFHNLDLAYYFILLSFSTVSWQIKL